MKKLIAVMLVLTMVLALAACGIKDDLVGTWNLDDACTPDEVTEVLGAFGFFESEIALASKEGMSAVAFLRFTEDNKYAMGYDEAASLAKLKAYYENLMNTLYENRAELEADYGEGFADDLADQAEFNDFFAYMFDLDSYEELINKLAEDTLSIYEIDESAENGTYKTEMSGGKVTMYVDGKGDGEYVEVTINGNLMTVVFADGSHVYVKQ